MAVFHDRLAPMPVLLVVLLLFGCGGGTDPSVPSAIALAPTAVTFTAIGQTQQLSAAITDQRGNPVDQATVTWSSSNQAVATVSPTGLVPSTGPGSTQVTAAVGGIAAIATVSVTQSVAAFEASSGNGQNGGAGQPLPQPLAVRATDALGSPIMGLTVLFTVSQGGGSVQPGSASTGLDGRASTVFTLGPSAGTGHQVTATLSGTSFSVTFSATAVSGFDVIVRYLTTPTASQTQAFADAESR